MIVAGLGPKGSNEGPKGANKGPKGTNEGPKGSNEGPNKLLYITPKEYRRSDDVARCLFLRQFYLVSTYVILV
jgi:hypothetical protein